MWKGEAYISASAGASGSASGITIVYSVAVSYPQSFFIHLPLKIEPIEGSETSTFRTQAPGIYPKENILYKEHGESLKSRHEKTV